MSDTKGFTTPNSTYVCSVKETFKSTSLTFGGSGISINLQTGVVTIPEGMTLDDASRLIWCGISRHVGRSSG